MDGSNASENDVELGTGQMVMVPGNISDRRPILELVKVEEVKWLAERLNAFYSKKAALVPNMFTILLILLKGYMYADTILSWSWIRVLFALQVVSFALNAFCGSRTQKMIREINREEVLSQQMCSTVEWLCNGAYVSTAVLMVTAAVPLLCYDMAAYLWVVVVPVLVLAFLFLFFLFRLKIDSGRRRRRRRHGDELMSEGCGHVIGASHYCALYERQLPFFFEFSSDVVLLGLAGIFGSFWGYIKGTMGAPGYKSPEGFLLCSSVLGLVAVLLTSVPPSLVLPQIRGRFVRLYTRILAYAALLFLAMACVAAAEQILHGFALLAVLVNFVIAALCFRKDHLALESETMDENRQVQATNVWTTSGYGCFVTVLMAAYSTHVQKPDDDWSWWPLKTCVLSLVCTIVTYLCWMVGDVETSQPRSSGHEKIKLLSYGGIFLALVTFVLVVICLQVPSNHDVVKTIFLG